MKKILSCQSLVAHGHVGNSTAWFTLQRLGFDVTALPTVMFSNHPGHGGFGGRVLPADFMGDLVDGLAAHGLLAGHDGVLSGYLGDCVHGPALLRAVAANPGVPFLCDPVMGDHGEIYVRPGIPEFLAGPGLAAATIITPNLFELGLLTGSDPHGPEQAVAAARTLLGRGPQVIVVSSVAMDNGDIATAAITSEGAWLVATPRIAFDRPPHGTGDLLAALILAETLAGHPPAAMLARAVSRLYAVLDHTRALGRYELALVAGQDLLAAPPHIFAAQPA